MVRSVLANLHQGCDVFQPYNGVQCTAIALVALFLFMQHMPNISHLTSGDLDNVIADGTSLYEYISRTNGASGYLSHRDLPESFLEWNGIEGEIQYFYDRYYGFVDPFRTVNTEAGQTSFVTAWHDAIEISSYLLITFGDSTVAVYYERQTGSVYLFDSHQRNEMGIPDSNGNAVLMIFESHDTFLNYVMSMYNSFQYEMTPVHLIYPVTSIMVPIYSYTINQKNETKDCEKKKHTETTLTKKPMNFHNYCQNSENSIKKKKGKKSTFANTDLCKLLLDCELPCYYDNTYGEVGSIQTSLENLENVGLDIDVASFCTIDNVLQTGVSKQRTARQQVVKEKQLENLIPRDVIKRIEECKEMKEIEEKLKNEKPTDALYVSIRSFLVFKLLITNGQRCGAIRNIMVKDVVNAKRQNDLFIIKVRNHKTYQQFGAMNMITNHQIMDLLLKFLQWRPVATSEEDHLFLTSTGQQMTSSTINADLERVSHYVGWKKPVSATALRQFSATAIREYPENLRKTVASHMSHSTSTQAKYYILQQKEAQSAEAYQILNFARGNSNFEDNTNATEPSNLHNTAPSDTINQTENDNATASSETHITVALPSDPIDQTEDDNATVQESRNFVSFDALEENVDNATVSSEMHTTATLPSNPTDQVNESASTNLEEHPEKVKQKANDYKPKARRAGWTKEEEDFLRKTFATQIGSCITLSYIRTKIDNCLQKYTTQQIRDKIKCMKK